MDFLKNNAKLLALGLAVILAIAGAALKLDIPSLITSVTSINKQLGTITDQTAQ